MPYMRLAGGDALVVGGVRLPGVVQDGLEVEGALEIEEKQREDKAGKVTVIHGYTAASVTARIRLVPPDTAGQVARIRAVFAQDGTVKKLRVVHPLLAAMRVREVIFKRLRVTEANEAGAVDCALEFAEYDPELRKIQEKLDKAKKDAAGGASSPTGADPDAASGSTGKDGKPASPAALSPFAAGRADGNAGRGFRVPGSTGVAVR